MSLYVVNPRKGLMDIKDYHEFSPKPILTSMIQNIIAETTRLARILLQKNSIEWFIVLGPIAFYGISL